MPATLSQLRQHQVPVIHSDEVRAHLETALGGSYRVIEELTGGGMARVFAAEDLALGRRIVIKVLSPELAAAVNLDRFQRETQVAAGLQHANIVPVLAAGDVDGLPYYTMPYVSGRSVRDTMASSGRLPLRDVLTILRDVARALAYAHDRGVVHRDIKPDNILWAGGAAAVTDFGIAKAISAARTHVVRADLREPLTTAGMSLGTPAYMAPEQISADPTADHRTDIYSFGITAYELLCGRTPFAGRSQQQILTAHLTEKPQSVSSLVSGVPRVLAELVMQCLEKEPSRRPQTAAEILDVLAGITTGERVARPRSTLRRNVAAALALTLAVTVGGVAFWSGSSQVRAPARADLVAVVPFRVSTADPGLRYLREGMLDLLASKLTGEGGLRVVEPRTLLDAWHEAGGSETRDLTLARALEVSSSVGAGRLLLGDVVGTPTGVVLSATMVGVPSGDSIARVTVEGPPDSLAVLVDALARNLLLRTSGELPARMASLGGTNLLALRAYLDGQFHLRRNQAVAAADAFERALSHDSTFALAGLGLSLATTWFFAEPGRGDRGLQVAWRERQRLSQRDQALVEAIAGPRYPEQSSTLEVYRARQRYFELARDRADAWYLLGDHIFHYGLAMGMADPMREALRHFVRAAEIDSTYVIGYIHAIDLAAALGEAELSKRVMRMRALSDTSRQSDWFYGWLLAQSAGDTSRLAEMWRDTADAPSGRYEDIMRVALLNGFAAADGYRATLVLANRPDASPGRIIGGYYWALNVGHAQPARQYLERTFRDTAAGGDINRNLIVLRAANAGLASDADARAAAAALTPYEGGALSQDSTTRARQRHVTRGLEVWRLVRGDSSHTARSVARLAAYRPYVAPMERQDLELEIGLIQALHESLRRAPGRAPRLEHLDSLLTHRDWTRGHAGRLAEASLLTGRLFAQRREFARAAQAVRRRLIWDDTHAPYLAERLRDEGIYSAAAGDAAAAERAFAHYLRMRHDADATFAREVADVRGRLAQARAQVAQR